MGLVGGMRRQGSVLGVSIRSLILAFFKTLTTVSEVTGFVDPNRDPAAVAVFQIALARRANAASSSVAAMNK